MKKRKTFKTPLMGQCSTDNFGKEKCHNIEAMSAPMLQNDKNAELASNKFNHAFIGLTRNLIIDSGSLHGDLSATVARKDEKEFSFDELLKEVAHLALDQGLVARANMLEDGEAIGVESAEWTIEITTQNTILNFLKEKVAA